VNVTLEFQPRSAVLVLLELKIAEDWPLIRGWALSRLIAWAFFDQQESKREDGIAERPFKPNYAYKAGQLYLLYRGDRLWRDCEPSSVFSKPSSEKLRTALHLFLRTGEKREGFSLGGQPLSTLHRRAHRDLTIVYSVMDFLLRAYHLYRKRDLCQVDIARYFVEKFEPTTEHLSKRSIQGIWNHYRDAAPYIYGFYPAMYPAEAADSALAQSEIKTDAEWISRITQLAESSSLNDFLGHAAFAVNVLAGTDTRIVRIDDFDGVPLATPSLRKFDADEEAIIKSYDPKSPLGD
jgi:hypothetical protein